MHGAAAEVDAAADRLHHDRGDEIARDCGERLDAEDEHQDGSHERSAAHAGESDHRADDEPGERNAQVEVHAGLRGTRRAKATVSMDNVVLLSGLDQFTRRADGRVPGSTAR